MHMEKKKDDKGNGICTFPREKYRRKPDIITSNLLIDSCGEEAKLMIRSSECLRVQCALKRNQHCLHLVQWL